MSDDPNSFENMVRSGSITHSAVAVYPDGQRRFWAHVRKEGNPPPIETPWGRWEYEPLEQPQ